MSVISKTNPSSPSPQKGGWSAVFGCTYEGLALFRIVLGVLLTTELLLRFRFLRVYYTDEGTKPLRLLLPEVDNLYLWVCYHCRFGTLFQQQILLAIQVGVAIFFTIGYHTRLATVLSFYMYTSLILRNTWLYFILDRYFYYLLFYSMFLPLNKRHSLDAAKGTIDGTPSKGAVFVNPATVALKLLVFWIYIDAGFGKFFDPKQGWTYHADPLPALDTYARHTVFAQHLYGLLGPQGLRLMTPVVVYVEILCVPVALIASYFGNAFLVNFAIGTICQLHFGISLSIRNSHLLSYIACCPWLVFLPMGRTDKDDEERNRINSNSIDDANNASGDRASSSSTQTSKLGSLVTLAMVSVMVGGNIWFEGFSDGCYSSESIRLIWGTLLQNRWNVFIGAEQYVTWEIAPGRLQDGSVVDVWGRSDEVNWMMPGSGAPCTSTSRPGRWRNFPYGAELKGEEAEALWGYLCDEWDRDNDANTVNPGRKLLRFNFYMLQADVLPNMGFSSTRKKLVYSHECRPNNESLQEKQHSGHGNVSSGVQDEL